MQFLITFIVLLTALVGLYRAVRGAAQDKEAQPPATSNEPMTEAEAFKILGLTKDANEDDIRKAHLKLMKKFHPDQAGSDWLAQKINAAKELLLKSRV